MPVNAKLVRQRLKSINNIKKITKAMELVAAAKMRKAVRAALSTRDYARLAQEMLGKLSQMKDLSKHPLLQARPVKNILLLVITSNRGFCGGLNTNVYKKVVEQAKNTELLATQRVFSKHISPAKNQEIKISAITVGKKGERMMRKLGIQIVAAFNELSDRPKLSEILPIAKIINEEYLKDNFQKVAVVYTTYVSSISQRPSIRQLLPVSAVDLEKMLNELAQSANNQVDNIETAEFLFEPNPDEILEIMLPRLMETQLYQSVLESSASEHSARMMAMHSASDAAKDMIDDLTFNLNQARQAGITREIAEISGGAAALG